MHKTPDSLDGHFTSGLIMQQMIMPSVIITAKPMSYCTGKNNAPVTVGLQLLLKLIHVIITICITH